MNILNLSRYAYVNCYSLVIKKFHKKDSNVSYKELWKKDLQIEFKDFQIHGLKNSEKNKFHKNFIQFLISISLYTIITAFSMLFLNFKSLEERK